MFTSPHTTIASGPAASTSRSDASQASLYRVVIRVRACGRSARRPRRPARRRTSRPPRAPPAAGSPGRRAAPRPRRRARRARGSPRRSTPPRRAPRPRSRGPASSAPRSSANLSSASLVSCRQTTSGRRSSSHGSRRGSRCLTELTFQVAMRTAARYRRGARRRRASALDRARPAVSEMMRSTTSPAMSLGFALLRLLLLGDLNPGGLPGRPVA